MVEQNIILAKSACSKNSCFRAQIKKYGFNFYGKTISFCGASWFVIDKRGLVYKSNNADSCIEWVAEQVEEIETW